MDRVEIKILLYQELRKQVEQRIATALQAMQAAEESRDNESKSSVGDKYETGRAMMQIEQERNKVQLIKANVLKTELNQININKRSKVVELGSLVETNRGVYFLSIGLGKIELNGQKYFAISKQAPIGKILLGKIEGDSLDWQGKRFIIESVN